MISHRGGECEFGGIFSLSGLVVVVLCKEPTFSSLSKQSSGSPARKYSHFRASERSTSSRSLAFWLSRGPDPGREGVDF